MSLYSANDSDFKEIIMLVNVIIARANVSENTTEQAVGGRPPRYAPTPPPSVGAETPPSASRRRSHRNVAVVSHVEYVPTLTAAAALRVKAALSKAAW